MELLFVGSGAADYPAAMSCGCPNCREAREIGGLNVRTYASALVNGRLLVDCGPTVAWRLAELDVPPRDVEALLLTHAHSDHLDTDAIFTLARAADRERPLQVYGNSTACAELAAHGDGLTLHELAPGDVLKAGGMRVVALPANHDTDNQVALNYGLSSAEGSLIYATDTAWPAPQWWELASAVHPDVLVIEATFGPLAPGEHPDCLTHHLNWVEAERLVAELTAAGILSPQTQCYATHLSQHFVPIHDRWTKATAGSRLQVAHDGLRITTAP